MPTWRRSGFWTTSLRGLDLDALEPKRYERAGCRSSSLGDEEHAALIVQRGATVVHTDVADERIIVMPLEQAVEEHEELVREYFAKRLPHDEGKFAAGTAAFWTGGVFIHVPKDVQVEKPIQVVWLIDEPGTAQWAHTLAVVGEHAEVQDPRVLPRARLRGPGAALGRVRAVRPARAPRSTSPTTRTGAAARSTTCPPSASRSARDARVKWVPIHLGGRLTKQTLDIITAEDGLGHEAHRASTSPSATSTSTCSPPTGTRPATPPATPSGRARSPASRAPPTRA